MPLNIIRNNIVKVSADAIVNTANPQVAIGAGVDSTIYEAAGADKLLAEKKKKSRDPDVDVRTFFTDEELAALLRSEESFLGSAADLDKLRRYKRICSALKWMDTYCLEVQHIEFEFVSRERPNVVAVMDVRNVSSFTG